MNRTMLTVAGVFSASSLLLVDSAIKGTALLVLAAIAAMILRRDSAATRHLVWLLAIVAMLAVPVLSAMLPQWRVLPGWAGISPRPVFMEMSPPSIARPADGAVDLPQNAESVEIERPSATAYQPAAELPDSRPALLAPEIISESAVWSWNWLNALPLVWAIGFCVLILRLLAARLMLWNTERHGTVIWSSRQPAKATHDPIVTALEAVSMQLGICRPVTLMLHSDKTIPVVWGILRCHLLLPVAARQWTGEQLRSVLLHELAHVNRRDMMAQLLAQVACALYWFNPLVWFAAWRLGVERERACDDLVLACGVRPSAYAGHLLEVVTELSPARWTQSCGLAMARKSSLEGRLVAVLSEKLNRRRVSATIGAIALILGASIAVPIAMLRAAGNEPAAAAEDDPAAVDDRPAAAATEMKPKHLDAQSLFKKWQANARTDGKIPGALIGKLGAEVKYFISLNKDDQGGHDLAVKFELLLPRFDAAGDWTQSDAIALLDDISAIHSIPLRNTLEADEVTIIRAGEPLPAELAGAAWGQPAANGLRVAWLLEPRAKEYRLGTSLRSRILLHNSGKEAALFRVPSWQQSSAHTAHDATGAAINVSSTYWTTMARMMTYRLAPGEYCETPAPGIGVGARTDDEDWANVRAGAWIEAKQGDEVRFSPAAVEVRFLASAVGVRMMDGRPLTVEAKDAADLWETIIAERVGRELPLPAAAAERVPIIRRVTLDLFGEAPTPQEIAAFIADDAPTAQAALQKRLLQRPGIAPFTGTLPPGEIQFRVLAADPDAAKRPRFATGPGYYNLGDNQRLQVERTPNGNRRTNKATILFFSSDPKTDPPGKPYEIALPDGRLEWAAVWERGAGELWVMQKGLVRKYDFINPAQVQETRFERGGIGNVPGHLQEALRKVFDVPGAPVQQQESQKPNEGAKLQPGTEEKLEWGEPVNGLRMALAWPPTLGEPAAGEVPDLFLAVQNVSAGPVRLCTTAEAPNQRRLSFATDGVLQGRIVSSEPNRADVTLQPREVVFLRLFTEGAEDTDKASHGSMFAATVRQSPKFTLRADFEIAKAPAGAWTGKLVTPETRAGIGAEAPKNRKAQELFKVWLAYARVNGKIPGGCIARLGDRVKEFVRGNLADNAGEPYAKRMEPLVSRLDGTRDWQPAEASALLTDIAAVSDSPLSVLLEETAGETIQYSPSLPRELEDAPWGEALPNGLRVACLLEPRAAAHRLGTPLKMRILVHNAGKETVVFRSRTWHHIEPTARDAKGAEIEMESVTRFTRPPLVAYRLVPGGFVELASPGIGIGKYGFHDFKKADVASWISAKDGDEVTLTPGPVPLCDWNEASVLNGTPRWWLDFLTARLNLATPLPVDAAERAELLQRTVRDIFYSDATAEEIAAFVADREPDALESLAKRLAGRSGLTLFSGSLQSGATKFRVTAADPGGAKPADKPAASLSH